MHNGGFQVSMRMRFVALALGAVVLIAGFFFVGIKPARSRLATVKEEVATTQAEVAALQAKLAELQELQRNEKQLREEAERLSKGLPGKPGVSDFIRQVQGAASDAGIDFLTITPSVPADLAAPATGGAPALIGLKAISLALSANGSFFDVEEFIERMERLERAVRIDTFTLGGASPAPLSLSINMRMFMAAPAAAAPAAPAAPADGSAAASPAPTTSPATSG